MFTCTAGDLFELKKARQPEGEVRLTADFICRAFGKLDYDAVGLGEKDLYFGAAYLQEKAREFGLRFVSTNAVDAGTGEPIVEPFVVRERGGVRVGFLSVISPERHIVNQVDNQLQEHGIRLRDPSEALRDHLPAVRAEADLVVLLSHSGIETSRFLAEDHDVDVVVVGHFPAVAAVPEEVGGALMVMAGTKSDRFGTLDLKLAGDGTVTEHVGDAVRLLKDGPLDGELSVMESDWDRELAELREEQRKKTQREREEMLKDKKDDQLHARNGVFGVESCRSCHQNTFDAWMETPHATAFARLAEADAWDNPECLGCHVTGVAEKLYVADVNLPPEEWNVQCEECHGLGAFHARDGSYLTAGEATCLKCHDPENSPEFDFDVYSTYGVH